MVTMVSESDSVTFNGGVKMALTTIADGPVSQSGSDTSVRTFKPRATSGVRRSWASR